MKQKNPWKTKKSTKIYDNSWITVHHDEVLTPGGTDGIYGKVHYKNKAVGIVLLDEELNSWIVGQYRYTIDAYSWEIPEGGCTTQQSPLEAAKRELKEETGISAKKWKELMCLHTSNSVCDEIAYIFLARELSFGPSEPEDTEELALKKLPFDDLVELVHNGSITDAMSVAAIMKVDYMIKKGWI